MNTEQKFGEILMRLKVLNRIDRDRGTARGRRGDSIHRDWGYDRARFIAGAAQIACVDEHRVDDQCPLAVVSA